MEILIIPSDIIFGLRSHRRPGKKDVGRWEVLAPGSGGAMIDEFKGDSNKGEDLYDLSV